MRLRISLVVVSLLLSAAIGFALRRSESESSGGERKLRIGLSLDTLEVERWQHDRDLFTARARELGADVLAISASGDDERQVRDCQGLINDKVDVLVIVAHDGTAMAEAVRRAHEAAIPVIAYDRLILGCDLDLYVTCDNVRVGELQAGYIADRFKGKKARIVRIIGPKSDNNAALFKIGQDHVLQPLIDRGELTIVHEDYDDGWRADVAKRIVTAAITQAGRNIDAVLSPGDFTSGAVVQALSEEGLAGKVLVTGQDADLVACQRIVEGTQAMTIYKPLKQLAIRAADLAVKLGRRQPIVVRDSINNGKIDVPTVLLPVTVVDRESMDRTVIAEGFHTHAEIYGK